MLLERGVKDKNNRYMVGFDLSDWDAQISYLSLQKGEAETVPVVPGTQQYNIPAVLCKRFHANQWIFGREALHLAEAGEGTLVENLFVRAVAGEKVTVEGEEYEAVALLTLFIKKSFGLFSSVASTDKIDVLMFTMRELNARIIEVMEQVVGSLGLVGTRVCFQDHTESYYYYLLHQTPEFRTAQSVIFDFEEKLTVYRLEWNRRTTPVVAFVEKQDFPECIQPLWSGDEMVKKRQKEELDGQVLEYVTGLFRNRAILSVFLIGNGFQEDWPDRTLQYICKNRRVFKGNNLYSKGAAYAAGERFCPTKQGKEYFFLGKEKLKSNIGLQILREGKESYLALLDAGISWYDAKCGCELYLESGNSFDVVVTPLTNVFPEQEAAGRYPVRYERIRLEDLPERPYGATRLKIAMYMDRADHICLKIEDLGFGEIFKSSGLVWEKEIWAD